MSFCLSSYLRLFQEFSFAKYFLSIVIHTNVIPLNGTAPWNELGFTWNLLICASTTEIGEKKCDYEDLPSLTFEFHIDGHFW
jgi:hypothetical protein